MRSFLYLFASACCTAAACRPSDAGLLLLDLSLSDPLALESTAAPWRNAGYRVEYRRYYPHLTQGDLAAYHTLLLLGGREPERASDRLTQRDLSLLTSWVRGGGVVVFGYDGDGEGTFDRWAVNRWLASLRTMLAIDDAPLRDPRTRADSAGALQPAITPRRTSPLRDVGFSPFAAGRNHAIRVRHDRSVLARASSNAQPIPRAPVVAASRIGEGLFIVASRHALAAGGPELRPSTNPFPRPEEMRGAQVFWHALARWTLRPAEWASIPPEQQPPAPLELGGGPLPIDRGRTADAPPGEMQVTPLPAVGPVRDSAQTLRVPAWIRRHGMRVYWTSLKTITGYQSPSARARELDSLVDFLEGSGFGALAMDAPRADTAAAPWEVEYAEAVRRQVIERLQASGIRWIPVIRLPNRPVGIPPALGARGEPAALWCGIEPAMWDSYLATAYRAVARIHAEHPDIIPAVALELPLRGYTMGHDFCDATYRAALAAMRLDSAQITSLAARPPAERYHALLEQGLLGRYYEALESLIARRATGLRRDVRSFARDLVFVFRAAAPPADWFTLGVLGGFADPQGRMPIILWSRGLEGRGVVTTLERRGMPILWAVGVSPGVMSPGSWTLLEHALAEKQADGYWVDGSLPGMPASDSLVRSFRKLSRSLP